MLAHNEKYGVWYDQLDLSQLDLTDAELQSIHSPRVHGYLLRDNRLTDAGIAELLDNWPTLSVLDVSGNSIDGSFLLKTKRSVSIDKLILQRMPITDNNIAGFSKVQHEIRELILSDTDVTRAVLPVLAADPNLLRLDIGNGRICDADLAKLGQNSLAEIRLSGQQFTGNALRHFSPPSVLSLKGSSVSNQDFDLAGLFLSGLDISNTDLGDEVFDEVLVSSPYGYVNLSNTQISAEGLAKWEHPHELTVRLAIDQFPPDVLAKLRRKCKICLGQVVDE